jgi:hypothetical protein
MFLPNGQNSQYFRTRMRIKLGTYGFLLAWALTAVTAGAQWTSNLPIVSIQTQGQSILNEPKINATWRFYWKTDGSVNDTMDAPYDQGLIGIEYRGQSSQWFPQKSYGIELRQADSLGPRPVALCGFPASEDWVLYAPYLDKSLVRNALAYHMAREQDGIWAPSTQHVEVFLNGSYQGIYVLVERIKKDADRLDLATLRPDENSGMDRTGGYIFKVDKEDPGDWAWTSPYPAPGGNSGQLIRYQGVYPKADRVTAEQRSYLQAYVDSAEAALKAPSRMLGDRDWRTFWDMHSFVDFLLVNEATKNTDGYRISTYLHKDRNDRDGRLRAGPVWDFDLAFANMNSCETPNTFGFLLQYNTICPQDPWLIPFWWGRMWQDTAFGAEVRCRWEELTAGPWSLDSLFGQINAWGYATEDARNRHFALHNTWGQQVWNYPYPIASSYAQEVQMLKSWMQARWAWLDANIPSYGPCRPFPRYAATDFLIRHSPNPSRQGQAWFEVQSELGGTYALEFFDASGKILWYETLILGPGNHRITALENAVLPAGLYYWRVTNGLSVSLVERVVRVD